MAQPPTFPGGIGQSTNGPNVSQMIMNMMDQVRQGQTQLNQAIAEAMNQRLQINRNVERRSVEYKDRSELKGIPNPDRFNGASGTWDSWWYKFNFKTWVESCHTNALKIVAQVEAQCDKGTTESSLEVDCYDGSELVSAQARQAITSHDPQSPQATSALLKKVLHPSQCSS